MDNVCAYLDILGFKNHIKEDPLAASNLLSEYTSVIGNLGVGGKYKSFNYFLPFSDGIFIQSNDPSKFVFDLSKFLVESFLKNGFGNIIVERDNHSPVVDETKYTELPGRRPLLFRGGVAYGDSVPKRVSCIYDNKLEYKHSLIGEAVVEAVALEGKGRGPRVFCSGKFYESLDDNAKRLVINQFDDEEGKNYEIIWPASFFTENGFYESYYEFDRLFISSRLSWKAFNHKQYGINYYNFLKLIVLSGLHFWGGSPENLASVKRYIEPGLTKACLQNKRDDLFMGFK